LDLHSGFGPINDMKNKAIANLFMRASNYTGPMAGVNISMPKLNGLRCMYCPQTKAFWSRDGAMWNEPVLRHLQIPYGIMYPLDGELYCHGMNLQEITRAVAVGRDESGPRASEISFNLFDALVPDTNALERLNYLKTLDSSGNIRRIPYSVCINQEELDECYARYTEQGYEGQMIKPWQGGYIPQGEFKKPSINLVKRKGFLDSEYYCVAMTNGEKRLEGSIGALVFTTSTGVRFEVGTGFTDIERKEFLTNSPIGRKATIKYLNLTEGGKPFNASFVAWRDDV
jgi:DNA ligase 1